MRYPVKSVEEVGDDQSAEDEARDDAELDREPIQDASPDSFGSHAASVRYAVKALRLGRRRGAVVPHSKIVRHGHHRERREPGERRRGQHHLDHRLLILDEGG